MVGVELVKVAEIHQLALHLTSARDDQESQQVGDMLDWNLHLPRNARTVKEKMISKDVHVFIKLLPVPLFATSWRIVPVTTVIRGQVDLLVRCLQQEGRDVPIGSLPSLKPLSMSFCLKVINLLDPLGVQLQIWVSASMHLHQTLTLLPGMYIQFKPALHT